MEEDFYFETLSFFFIFINCIPFTNQEFLSNPMNMAGQKGKSMNFRCNFHGPPHLEFPDWNGKQWRRYTTDIENAEDITYRNKLTPKFDKRFILLSGGDFQIPSVEFDDSAIYICQDDLTQEQRRLFFLVGDVEPTCIKNNTSYYEGDIYNRTCKFLYKGPYGPQMTFTNITGDQLNTRYIKNIPGEVHVQSNFRLSGFDNGLLYLVKVQWGRPPDSLTANENDLQYFAKNSPKFHWILALAKVNVKHQATPPYFIPSSGTLTVGAVLVCYSKANPGPMRFHIEIYRDFDVLVMETFLNRVVITKEMLGEVRAECRVNSSLENQTVEKLVLGYYDIMYKIPDTPEPKVAEDRSAEIAAEYIIIILCVLTFFSVGGHYIKKRKLPPCIYIIGDVIAGLLGKFYEDLRIKAVKDHFVKKKKLKHKNDTITFSEMRLEALRLQSKKSSVIFRKNKNSRVLHKRQSSTFSNKRAQSPTRHITYPVIMEDKNRNFSALSRHKRHPHRTRDKCEMCLKERGVNPSYSRLYSNTSRKSHNHKHIRTCKHCIKKIIKENKFTE